MNITLNININCVKYFANADESIIPKANILFNSIKSIPANDFKNGYKLEIGFTVFIFLSEKDGYKIVVPDYLNNPFFNTTDDLTIALWILSEQIELLEKYNISGVPVRFDDEIVTAVNALENSLISLQRYSNLGKNASGWCIESIGKKEDGSFYTIETKEYKTIYAYELLQTRPELLKILVMPYEYFVVINDETVIEILNEKNESVIDK